jgi:hypothetical protein
VVDGAIPPEVAKGRRWHDPFNRTTGQQFFSWKVFDDRHNRTLTIEVTRRENPAKAKEKSAYVRNVLADDHVREGRLVVDTGKVEKIAGIADECLSFHISRRNAMSELPWEADQKYSMSGRYLYCRFKNVNTVIDWEGQNYSARWAVDSGAGMNDATANSDTLRIARTIVAALRGT